MHMLNKIKKHGSGFTIVELLIVVVVIAILAAITIVAYNGISKRAVESSMQADLHTAATVIGKDNVTNGTYPANLAAANGGLGLTSSGGNQLTYSNSGTDYCVSVANPKTSLVLRVKGSTGTIESGTCDPVDGTAMQTITNANCPSTRIRAVDARDNRTYWVQKLADGKCWMLTNLAYAGGGTNTYNDVMPTGDGTAGTLNGPDNSGANTYTLAKYYVHANANPTSNPTNPSTSTDAGATSPQFGYLYNWCATMKGQATSACANATTPAVNSALTICPAGWRVPTGGAGGEFAALNTAVNGGSTTSDAGLIANPWMSQRSGGWSGGSFFYSAVGAFHSSTPSVANSPYGFYVNSSSVQPAINNLGKVGGYAVRCVT